MYVRGLRAQCQLTTQSLELDSRKRLQTLGVTSAILERGLLETARERWRALRA